jgi:hypothetical protein
MTRYLLRRLGWVVGAVMWLLGGYRAVPRHNEDNCEDCGRGRCDRSAVVI